MNNKTMKPAWRHKARKYALQALYQWQLSGTDLQEIEIQFHTFNDLSRVDVDYFQELLHQIPAQLDIIDGSFKEYLERPFKDLNPVELAILRIGCYELLKRPDVPYRVIINEALELTKTYGAEEGHKFVNGVLDKVAQQVRKDEA